MTRFQANFIKLLRVRHDYTWRAIAREWYERYGQYNPSHQMFGQQLCNEAMELLGEKVEEGWN